MWSWKFKSVINFLTSTCFLFRLYLSVPWSVHALCQGAFHALRPEDLRRGVCYPVGVAARIQLELYYLAYWCNIMQTSTHGSFDLCASGVRQSSMLAYT